MAKDISSVSEALRLAIDTFLKESDIRDRLDQEAEIGLEFERDRRGRQKDYG